MSCPTRCREGRRLKETGGGIVFHFFGPLAPFEVTFCLLVFTTIFGSVFLPYVAPEQPTTGQNEEKSSRSFLAPLNVFVRN